MSLASLGNMVWTDVKLSGVSVGFVICRVCALAKTCSWAGGVAGRESLACSLFLLHAWDELSDTEVLDEGLKDWVSVDLDVLDLDLGLLGDEIHLSFSLLL